MRITLVAPCKDLSGGIKVIAKYGNLLLERGHQVSIVYPASKLPLLRGLKRVIKKWLKRQKDHLDNFNGNLLALREVTEHTVPDAEVIIATAWETAEWIKSFSAAKGEKVYLIQGHEVWNASQDRVYETLRYPFKKITISSWLKDLVEEISGDTSIEIIPNASDHVLENFDADEVIRHFDIGMTYSSIPNKGADIGLEALNRIKKQFPHARFILFGSEQPESDLPEDCEFYERPSQAKISEIYRQTKIWISTSYEEGFCLPCLEAAASGAAVISTDNKGVRDIIVHEDSGYITETGNVDYLELYLKKLMESDELLERMRKNAHRRSKLFNWKDSGDKLHRILTEQVGESL